MCSFVRTAPVRFVGSLKERRRGGIPRIKFQRAVDVLEVSAYARDHHVPGAKLRCRVPGLESPFRHEQPSLLEHNPFPGQ